MKPRHLVIAVAALVGAPGLAEPTAADAQRVFADAKAICERDQGVLWGRSICGPLMLVDRQDRALIANTTQTGGYLRPDGEMFRGTLPDTMPIANMSVVWAGQRWTQLVAPIPDDSAARRVLIAHELFHSIQGDLWLARPEAGNKHLDTLEGRYLLQLEWRALARALQTTRADRDRALADALAFRQERYRIFPTAHSEEYALETNEGLAEYTGVRLGLETAAERKAYALRDLEAFVAAPTFVRAFAYATGPAYGLLLDDAVAEWRDDVRTRRFDELLMRAVKPGTGVSLASRIARYDDGTLRSVEEKREADRLAQNAALQARFVDGPVLRLSLIKTNYEFNPQTLVPLEDLGTVYPTIRITDLWGSLEVEAGGALVNMNQGRGVVSAAGIAADRLSGEGWKLQLNPRYAVEPSDRPGDFVLVCKRDCQ